RLAEEASQARADGAALACPPVQQCPARTIPHPCGHYHGADGPSVVRRWRATTRSWLALPAQRRFLLRMSCSARRDGRPGVLGVMGRTGETCPVEGAEQRR